MLVSIRGQWICRTCRNELLSLWRNEFLESKLRSRAQRPYTYFETRHSLKHSRSPKNLRLLHTTPRRYDTNQPSEVSGQQRDQSHHDVQLVAGEKKDVGNDHIGEDVSEVVSSVDANSPRTKKAREQGLGLEGVARQARQEHGEYLPPGILTEEELARYVRLYGEPAESFEQDPREDGVPADKENEPKSRLYRNKPDGSLEAVEVDLDEDQGELEHDHAFDDLEPEEDEETDSLNARAAEAASQVGGEVYHDEDGNIVDNTSIQSTRIHPLTLEGKFSAQTRTIFLPQSSLTDPVSKILSGYSNKHISETALKLFGGSGLPSGVATPMSRRGDMQIPIGLTVSQHSMGEMEANAFIAALWPGVYAAVMSVLVEVRKRLGTDWLKKLLSKEGGPRVLDVGSGGVAIIAWREIVKAEWQALYPDEPVENALLGKATVLTGADSLRHRSAALLENTTFLPRLPDYVHVRDKATLNDDREAPQRKQFDVVLAPHSLWNLKEEYLRKQHLQNLWSLLSSDGGVLVILEKGVPRGFEVVAAAREQILDRFISSPGSDIQEDEQQPGADWDSHFIHKRPGMIIAPCTNHTQCPLYTTPGHSAGRRDLCTFEQRYVRPQYLQRILKAKHRNHEDLRFSYLAVLKGHDHRIPSVSNPNPLVQGAVATNAAFAGHEQSSAPDSVNTLSLPRLIYSAIKRRGHVTMDVCTPEGRAERWTVPKSFSKQAHHDARKSSWGDLWALGAKTRVPRNVRLGKKKGVWTKEERIAARREEREARKEDQRIERSLGKDLDGLGAVESVARELDNEIFGEDEDDVQELVREDVLDDDDYDVAVDEEEYDDDDDDDDTATDYNDTIADPENWKAWQEEYETDRHRSQDLSNQRQDRFGSRAGNRPAGMKGPVKIRSPTPANNQIRGGKNRKRIGVGY